MRYFPVNLDIRGRRVVIVGGGSVAARKCSVLLDAGAAVTVISPSLTRSLQDLAEKGEIEHLPKEYAEGDIAGSSLVFAATDNGSVNMAVAREAKGLGILANVADSADLCSFTLPAVISRGELMITVSTGGAAPALAAKIREDLEERYGPEYGELNGILERVREKLLTEKANNQYNKRILHSLLQHDLSALLKTGAFAEVDRILSEVCGPGFTLAELARGEKDN